MSKFSLHIGHETTGLRDCETTRNLLVPKSRSPVSRSQKILQFNFEQLLINNVSDEWKTSHETKKAGSLRRQPF